MSNIALTVDTINQLKPLEVVENETVKARFIQIYDTLWGAGTGEAAYERESFYFNNKLPARNTACGIVRNAKLNAVIHISLIAPGVVYRVLQNSSTFGAYRLRTAVAVFGYGIGAVYTFRIA